LTNNGWKGSCKNGSQLHGSAKINGRHGPLKDEDDRQQKNVNYGFNGNPRTPHSMQMHRVIHHRVIHKSDANNLAKFKPQWLSIGNPQYRLDDPGVGLRNNGRKVLVYADLRNLHMTHNYPDAEQSPYACVGYTYYPLSLNHSTFHADA
jgi:hypothetical protein